MNKVFLIGRLGQDPEVKQTQGGQQIVKFSLATTKTWMNEKTGKQERTEWHRCIAWGDRWNGVLPYLKVGGQIAIEGSVQYEQWEKDGVKHTSCNINVDQIELLGSKRDDNQQRGGQQSSSRSGQQTQQRGGGFGGGQRKKEPAPYDGGDDDIPF